MPGPSEEFEADWGGREGGVGLGFRVWGLGFGVWGLGFGVWGLGLVALRRGGGE